MTRARVSKLGLVAALAAASLAWGFGTVDPAAPRWVMIHATAAALLLHFALSSGPTRWPRLAWPVLALSAYAGASLAWSPDPGQGLLALADWAALGVVFVFVAALDRETLTRWLPPAVAAIAGALAALAMALPEIDGGAGNPNFAAEYLIMAAPFALLLAGTAAGRRLAIPALLLIAVYLLFFNPSNLKWLALAVAALAMARRRWFFAAALAALVPLNLALYSGLVSARDVTASLASRLELFVNTGALWWDSPVAGHGLGGFRFEYPRFQEAHLQVFPEMGTLIRPVTQFVNTPHNEFLWVLADLGAIGLALVVLAAWVFAAAVLRKQRDRLDTAAAASLGLAAVVAMVGFPAHLPATALLAVIAAGILANGTPWVAVTSTRCIAGLAGAALALAVALPVLAACTYAARVHMARVQLHLDARPVAGFRANLAAWRWMPLAEHPRRQLPLSLGHLVKSGGDGLRLRPGAADRVHEIATSAGRYNPAVLIERVEYLINSGRHIERRAEIESIMADLRPRARLQPSFWLADAWLGALTGDARRAARAVQHGLPLAGHAPVLTAQFQRLAGALNK